jgi:hypothetical protein
VTLPKGPAWTDDSIRAVSSPNPPPASSSKISDHHDKFPSERADHPVFGNAREFKLNNLGPMKQAEKAPSTSSFGSSSESTRDVGGMCASCPPTIVS